MLCFLNFRNAPFYLSNGAFLKTQRHKFLCHFDIKMRLFNLKSNPILCFLDIRTLAYTTSPPRCICMSGRHISFANLIFKAHHSSHHYIYLFISPLNMPSLVTEKSRTPPPHAAAARCRRTPHAAAARCRMPPPHAAADAFVARRRFPPPTAA